MSSRPDQTPSFWRDLSSRHRDELRRLGSLQCFPAASTIVRQHDRSDHVFIILRGCVKVVSHTARGYQTVLALRTAGELVGELSGFDGEPRSADLCAISVVDALVIGSERFHAFLRARPEVEQIVRRTIAGRLREADHARAAVGAESTSCRLASLLLHLGERHGATGVNGEIVIELPLSQDDLAGLVLTSRRTVGRVLELWRGRGLVVTGRRTILIQKPDGLARLVEGA